MCVCVCVHVHTCVCTYVSVCKHMCLCLSLSCTNARICVLHHAIKCVCVCVCVCVGMCVLLYHLTLILPYISHLRKRTQSCTTVCTHKQFLATMCRRPVSEAQVIRYHQVHNCSEKQICIHTSYTLGHTRNNGNHLAYIHLKAGLEVTYSTTSPFRMIMYVWSKYNCMLEKCL
jgi:hypothetical protein